jgi:hypothetical protein
MQDRPAPLNLGKTRLSCPFEHLSTLFVSAKVYQLAKG